MWMVKSSRNNKFGSEVQTKLLHVQLKRHLPVAAEFVIFNHCSEYREYCENKKTYQENWGPKGLFANCLQYKNANIATFFYVNQYELTRPTDFPTMQFFYTLWRLIPHFVRLWKSDWDKKCHSLSKSNTLKIGQYQLAFPNTITQCKMTLQFQTVTMTVITVIIASFFRLYFSEILSVWHLNFDYMIVLGELFS